MASCRCYASCVAQHLRAAPRAETSGLSSREGWSWFVPNPRCVSLESSRLLVPQANSQRPRCLTTSRHLQVAAPERFSWTAEQPIVSDASDAAAETAGESDDGADHQVIMEREQQPLHTDSGGKLWPFFSPLEEALGDHTAGEYWPFLPKLDNTELANRLLPSIDSREPSPVDVAVLANSIANLPRESKEYLLALSQLQRADIEAALPSFPPSVLTAIVAGVGELQQDADALDGLRRRALEELLKCRSLRARHAACLLRSVDCTSSDGKPLVPPSKILEVCTKILSEHPKSNHELLPLDVVAALEGVARLQCKRPSTYTILDKDHVVSVCNSLLLKLQGGAGLAGLVINSYDCSLATRILSSLLVLPDVLEQNPSVSAWLTSLHRVHWPRRLSQDLSEFQVAAAACMLAKVGAWTQTRCSFLLARAMSRDRFEKKWKRAGLPPEAGALWLHAIALAKLELDSATDQIPVEDVLLGSVETLASLGDAAPESLARALYGLQALGKAEERGLSESLLARLEALDATRFSSPTWEVLGDYRSLISSVGSDLPEVFRTDPWLEALGELPASGSNEENRAEDE